MSSGSGSNWADWITAGGTLVTLIGGFMLAVGKRIFGSVTRKEFKDYLEKRDRLADERHTSNTQRLDKIVEDLQDVRERTATIEGRLAPR